MLALTPSERPALRVDAGAAPRLAPCQLLPRHVCPTVNLADEAVLLEAKIVVSCPGRARPRDRAALAPPAPRGAQAPDCAWRSPSQNPGVLIVPPSLRPGRRGRRLARAGAPTRRGKVDPLLDAPARAASGYFRVRALVYSASSRMRCATSTNTRPFEADRVARSDRGATKRTGGSAAPRRMRRLVSARAPAIGWFNLGCYLALLGQSDEAIDAVTMACGSNPSYASPQRPSTTRLAAQRHPLRRLCQVEDGMG